VLYIYMYDTYNLCIVPWFAIIVILFTSLMCLVVGRCSFGGAFPGGVSGVSSLVAGLRRGSI
jgi:hypothetical protein